MAKIECADKETHERLERCFRLPVDRGKGELRNWFSNMVSSWSWDDTCRLESEPYNENWFAWSVRGSDGSIKIVGGLIYRDNGWESHT